MNKDMNQMTEEEFRMFLNYTKEGKDFKKEIMENYKAIKQQKSKLNK